MLSLSFRNAIAATRIITGLFAVASLTLFGMVIDNAFSLEHGMAENAWVSTLPAIALVIAILWNIVALLTRSRMRLYGHAAGDFINVALLTTLGATGFSHDNENYLKNGFWRDIEPEGYDDWLTIEKWAASLLLVTTILQLFLVFLNSFQHRNERKEFHDKCKFCGCQNGAVLENMETGLVKIDVVGERKYFENVMTSSDTDVEEEHKGVKAMG